MATNITVTPAEESTAKVSVTFTDEDGASVTPTAVTWSLYDRRGNVINSRSAVAATPATTVIFALTGNDLALTSSDPRRVLLLEWTYDSDLGDDLPGKAQAFFSIENLTGVS